MRRAALIAFVSQAGVACTLGGQALPAGWRAVSGGAAVVDGEQQFEATGLPAGEFLTIRRSAMRLIEGRALDAWLAAAVASEPAPSGDWIAPVRAASQTGNMATVAREFTGTNGVRGGVVYIGVSADRQQARVLRLAYSSAQVMTTPQGAAAKALMSRLAAEQVNQPRREGSGVAIDADPPQRSGIRAGGRIVPGRYVGTLVNGKGEVITRYDLTLFDNGEWAMAQGADGRDTTGRYTYAEASGALNITGRLRTSRYSPDEDFCIFGHDASGTPVIYAEDDYGISVFKARLRRVGDISREPPSAVAAAKAAARAEAARYKFVTANGSGIRAQDIESVYYEWKQVYEIGGLQLKEEVYLLLRDGTVHRGLPVPPQDMDVTASRRFEPDTWGRWRRAGETYAFAWPDAPSRYVTPQGAVVIAARPGMNLQGTWTASSSFEIPGAAGAWSKFGVTFLPGGQFERFKTGGAGMTSGSGDAAVTTAMVYDDNGSAGGVASATVGGGSSRRTPDTGNRRGTYRIDGYAILLTYENGSVERKPFVVQLDRAGGVRGVWMLGAMLTVPRK